jgi:hypothetical protein
LDGDQPVTRLLPLQGSARRTQKNEHILLAEFEPWIPFSVTFTTISLKIAWYMSDECTI